MAGASVRRVRMRPPDFAFPIHELRAAISPRTRLILINSPHNPTGRVLADEELRAIAALAVERDCLVVSDEVYEHIWFERRHRSIVTLPGMRERTVVLSSLGKTFSLTGWKIGWAIAPPAISQAIRSAHQFLTFCSATPLQRAAADALAAPPAYFEQLRSDYASRRDALLRALRLAGFDPYVPEGSYFVLARHAHFGFPDDEAFCEHLIRSVGVAAIPCSPFYGEDRDDAGRGELVRFAFCKDIATIEEAGRRLKHALKPVAR
jgi:N-succinyldiaminopimelate aminotransferase